MFKNGINSKLEKYIAGTGFLLTVCLVHAGAFAADPGDACNAAMEDTWQVSDTDPDIKIQCDGAQWRILEIIDESGTSTSRVKQAVTFGNVSEECDTDMGGTLRYTGGDPAWEYCDGSQWSSLVPIQAETKCVDDMTIECLLETGRNNGDPEFIAGNIKAGKNILGVQGTLTSGLCEYPPSCINVGDTCSDGSIFAGFMLYDGECEALFVTYKNQPNREFWSTENVVTGAKDYTDGRKNHHLISANRDLSDYPALLDCETLEAHSHQDWYLPATGELFLLFQNKEAINELNTLINLWSSVEIDADEVFFMTQSVIHSSIQKSSVNYNPIIRCVRRSDPCAEDEPGPGTVCADGTIYVGESDDGNFPMYLTRCNPGMHWDGSSCTGTRDEMTWNNGSPNWTETGFQDDYTGELNTIGLASLSDAGSPYEAAEYCYNLEAHGHDDWYLPAEKEAGLIRDFAEMIDGIAEELYWTSTELDISDPQRLAWRSRPEGNYHAADKNTSEPILCVRTVDSCEDGTATVGTVCNNGMVYAGISPYNDAPIYTTPCDAGMSWDGSSCTGTRDEMTWNNGSSNWTETGFQDDDTGDLNTIGLASLSDAGSPYEAVEYCHNLEAHGHDDWYLPARSERNLSDIEGPYSLEESEYWSSTEYDDNSLERAGTFMTQTVGTYWRFKNSTHPVRCMRKHNPCDYSPSPGTVCKDGTVYAGISGREKMFITRCDAGQSWDGSSCSGTRIDLPWNDGNTDYTFTGVPDAKSGEYNTNKLNFYDSNSVQSGAQPHMAAKYCADLYANGYSDWYLPAVDELVILYNNLSASANFEAADYWSSTEYDWELAKFVRLSTGGSTSAISKNAVPYANIRCARKK